MKYKLNMKYMKKTAQIRRTVVPIVDADVLFELATIPYNSIFAVSHFM